MADDDDENLCPLCVNVLSKDDRKFRPCPCGYQICVFCLERIKDADHNRCPACRTTYDPEKYTYLSSSDEEDDSGDDRRSSRNRRSLQTSTGHGNNSSLSSLSSLSSSTGGSSEPVKKALNTVRVIQRNLVYVTNLAMGVAKPETLKKNEYFGQYGKILKVVINKNHIYNANSPHGACVSAYITYQRKEDALSAIQAIDGATVEGRTLRASFGTTKYCSYFLRKLQCNNPDCMYLHEWGQEDDSFSKDDVTNINRLYIGHNEPAPTVSPSNSSYKKPVSLSTSNSSTPTTSNQLNSSGTNKTWNITNNTSLASSLNPLEWPSASDAMVLTSTSPPLSKSQERTLPSTSSWGSGLRPKGLGDSSEIGSPLDSTLISHSNINISIVSPTTPITTTASTVTTTSTTTLTPSTSSSSISSMNVMPPQPLPLPTPVSMMQSENKLMVNSSPHPSSFPPLSSSASTLPTKKREKPPKEPKDNNNNNNNSPQSIPSPLPLPTPTTPTLSKKEIAEKERLERERLEKMERERLEKLERERLEKVERDRLEKERLEKLEKERLERERLEKERLEKERLEKERIEREKEMERLEKARLEREQLDKERIEILTAPERIQPPAASSLPIGIHLEPVANWEGLIPDDHPSTSDINFDWLPIKGNSPQSSNMIDLLLNNDQQNSRSDSGGRRRTSRFEFAKDKDPSSSSSTSSSINNSQNSFTSPLVVPDSFLTGFKSSNSLLSSTSSSSSLNNSNNNIMLNNNNSNINGFNAVDNFNSDSFIPSLPNHNQPTLQQQQQQQQQSSTIEDSQQMFRSLFPSINIKFSKDSQDQQTGEWRGPNLRKSSNTTNVSIVSPPPGLGFNQPPPGFGNVTPPPPGLGFNQPPPGFSLPMKPPGMDLPQNGNEEFVEIEKQRSRRGKKNSIDQSPPNHSLSNSSNGITNTPNNIEDIQQQQYIQQQLLQLQQLQLQQQQQQNNSIQNNNNNNLPIPTIKRVDDLFLNIQSPPIPNNNNNLLNNFSQPPIFSYPPNNLQQFKPTTTTTTTNQQQNNQPNNLQQQQYPYNFPNFQNIRPTGNIPPTMMTNNTSNNNQKPNFIEFLSQFEQQRINGISTPEDLLKQHMIQQQQMNNSLESLDQQVMNASKEVKDLENKWQQTKLRNNNNQPYYR